MKQLYARTRAALAILLPALLLLAATPAQAQTVELVKDLKPGSSDGVTQPSFSVLNGELYFRGDDGTNGRELFKTDGTAAGTVLVKDIFPGVDSSDPFASGGFAFLNGELFFQADGGTGDELWKTDGTTAGTVQVKEIAPGGGFFGSSSPQAFIEYNGELFFAASDGATSGRELWKTDGTAAGTVLVKDINPGGGFFLGSNPFDFTLFNGELFFTAEDATSGKELWKSDGTAAGTVLVKDIWPGAQGSFLGGLTVFNGELFFGANDGSTGRELWKTDGTAAGTVLVKDIRPGVDSSNPFEFTVFNGELFFRANDGSTGTELWKTDGTPAGTVLAVDTVPGSDGVVDELTVFNGELFFANFEPTNGWELWKTDGITAVLLKDINPGTSGSFPEEFFEFDGKLFFLAEDDVNGEEIWVVRGPRGDLEAVRDDLQALIDGATCGEDADEDLEKAVEKLTKALDDENWFDDSTLDSQDGKKVFFQSKKAVKELEDVIEGAGPCAGDAQAALDALVAIMETFAQRAIDEATDVCSQITDPDDIEKCQDELAKAAEDMTKAAEKLAEGKPDKAVDHYKKAWEHAQKALEAAGAPLPGPLAGLREDMTMVRDDLASLLPTGDEGTDGHFTKAIEHIDLSLDVALWIDNTHLDPDDGQKVFEEDKKAVEELEKIVEEGGPFVVDAQVALDALVEVAETLAQTAIDEVDCLADPACEDELFKAAEDMTTAAEKLAEGKPNEAVDHYKKAWEHARKAAEAVAGKRGADVAEAAAVPESFALSGNYPNPFNPTTTIRFDVPEASVVKLAVYDVLGRQVRLLVDGARAAGVHTVTFEASDLASGTYLYRLETPQGSFTQLMHLVK